MVKMMIGAAADATTPVDESPIADSSGFHTKYIIKEVLGRGASSVVKVVLDWLIDWFFGRVYFYEFFCDN